MKLTVGILIAFLAIPQAWSYMIQHQPTTHLGVDSSGSAHFGGFQFFCQPPPAFFTSELDNATQTAIANAWSSYNASSGDNCTQQEEETHQALDNYFVAQITAALAAANLSSTQTALAQGLINAFTTFKNAPQPDQDAVIQFFTNAFMNLFQSFVGGQDNSMHPMFMGAQTQGNGPQPMIMGGQGNGVPTNFEGTALVANSAGDSTFAGHHHFVIGTAQVANPAVSSNIVHPSFGVGPAVVQGSGGAPNSGGSNSFQHANNHPAGIGGNSNNNHPANHGADNHDHHNFGRK